MSSRPATNTTRVEGSPKTPSDSYSLPAHRTWTVVLSAVGQFMVALDTLIVTTSLPALRAGMHTNLEGLEGRSTPSAGNYWTRARPPLRPNRLNAASVASSDASSTTSCCASGAGELQSFPIETDISDGRVTPHLPAASRETAAVQSAGEIRSGHRGQIGDKAIGALRGCSEGER